MAINAHQGIDVASLSAITHFYEGQAIAIEHDEVYLAISAAYVLRDFPEPATLKVSDNASFDAQA